AAAGFDEHPVAAPEDILSGGFDRLAVELEARGSAGLAATQARRRAADAVDHERGDRRDLAVHLELEADAVAAGPGAAPAAAAPDAAALDLDRRLRFEHLDRRVRQIAGKADRRGPVMGGPGALAGADEGVDGIAHVAAEARELEIVRRRARSRLHAVGQRIGQ